MKKLLLSCFMALGICANAQTVFYTQDFETAANGSDGTDIGWQGGYFGTLAAYPYNTFAVRSDCATNVISGTKSLQIINVANATQDADWTLASCNYGNGSTTNANYAPLVYTQINASNYKDLLLSYKWKCQGQNNADYGQLMYSVDGATWTSLATNLRNGTAPYLTTVTDFALPAALNFTTFYIGWRFVHNTTTLGQPGFTVDDISIKGNAPTIAPSCVTFTSPVNGSTISAGTATFSWPADANASGYKVVVGTTSGASNVYNATVTGLSATVPLTQNGTYYAKVTPTNNIGDATGCTEITFTTNNTLAYCAAPTLTTIEPITNVNFAGINNTSSATVGGTPSYQDFTSVKGSVEQSKSYTISVNGNSDGAFANFYAVFIDWNQNGVLNDAGEVYFSNGSLTLTGSTGTGTPATGTIAVPAGAKLGDTRMRVKKVYYGNAATAAASTSFANPCVSSDSSFGQIEDYTIEVKEFLAATDINKANLSVYPNPFTSVLNISDLKGIKSVSVNDISGREVKTLAPAAELNLSSLKAGLYIVNLKMEDGSVKTFKAIKK